ncbi:MAG: ATP-binding protein [Polyangiaceae bacterium]|nr:ATP-binding protein [Polyangiaceae bacterium]
MVERDCLFLEAALSVPPSAVRYRLGRIVTERAGTSKVVQIEDGEVSLDHLVAEAFCVVEPRPDIHTEIVRKWKSRGEVGTKLALGVFTLRWEGSTFEAVVARWVEGFDHRQALFLTGADGAALDRFVVAALDTTYVPRRSVLAFSHSCFQQDRALYAAAQEASWEDIVLPGDLGSRLREEVTSFLGARELYAKYAVPYKRGILLTGPPGNGKTHCVRLLVKEAALPTIYVKSFAARYEDEDANISRVFERARAIAPCLLVLEDLDSLVRPHCLSVFLNELDGLRSDTGILSVATTNHPERLDPALRERPSRFDRKYHLDLPALEERRRYLEHWNQKLERDLRIDGAAVTNIVERTEGMSFAFLKELVVSALSRWMTRPKHDSMGALALAELDGLRSTWTKVEDGEVSRKSEPPSER